MNRKVHDGTPCSYDDAYSVCFQGECEVFIYIFNSSSQLDVVQFLSPTFALHTAHTGTGATMVCTNPDSDVALIGCSQKEANDPKTDIKKKQPTNMRILRPE